MATPDCILVVDDDRDIRETLIEFLAEHGCTVAGAANGQQALDALAKFPARLILLDLMMPVMDGRTFREEQMKRQEFAGIPVVVISAHPDKRAEMEALDVAGFLSKPLDPDDILQTAQQYCICDAAR